MIAGTGGTNDRSNTIRTGTIINTAGPVLLPEEHHPQHGLPVLQEVGQEEGRFPLVTQIQELHLSEFVGVALGLKGDIARFQRASFCQGKALRKIAAYLGLGIC